MRQHVKNYCGRAFKIPTTMFALEDLRQDSESDGCYFTYDEMKRCGVEPKPEWKDCRFYIAMGDLCVYSGTLSNILEACWLGGTEWSDERTQSAVKPEPKASYDKDMPTNTNDILGYRVLYPCDELFVDYIDGRNVFTEEPPVPVSRGDAFRRLAAFLDAKPGYDHNDFTVVPVEREATPLEKASGELADLLQSLCSRNGLDLKMTPAQVREQLAKELITFVKV